jgi:hypothetical protein
MLVLQPFVMLGWEWQASMSLGLSTEPTYLLPGHLVRTSDNEFSMTGIMGYESLSVLATGSVLVHAYYVGAQCHVPIEKRC